MVTATQRAAGASLANLNTTTTKKIGMWVDELGSARVSKEWIQDDR